MAPSGAAPEASPLDRLIERKQRLGDSSKVFKAQLIARHSSPAGPDSTARPTTGSAEHLAALSRARAFSDNVVTIDREYALSARKHQAELLDPGTSYAHFLTARALGGNDQRPASSQGVPLDPLSPQVASPQPLAPGGDDILSKAHFIVAQRSAKASPRAESLHSVRQLISASTGRPIDTVIFSPRIAQSTPPSVLLDIQKKQANTSLLAASVPEGWVLAPDGRVVPAPEPEPEAPAPLVAAGGIITPQHSVLISEVLSRNSCVPPQQSSADATPCAPEASAAAGDSAAPVPAKPVTEDIDLLMRDLAFARGEAVKRNQMDRSVDKHRRDFFRWKLEHEGPEYAIKSDKEKYGKERAAPARPDELTDEIMALGASAIDEAINPELTEEIRALGAAAIDDTVGAGGGSGGDGSASEMVMVPMRSRRKPKETPEEFGQRVAQVVQRREDLSKKMKQMQAQQAAERDMGRVKAADAMGQKIVVAQEELQDATDKMMFLTKGQLKSVPGGANVSMDTASAAEKYVGTVEQQSAARMVQRAFKRKKGVDSRSLLIALQNAKLKLVVPYKDGSKYSGEFSNRQRNGNGLMTWADGDSYAGEFKEGQVWGHGVFFWQGGNSYSGECRDGLQDGVGVYEAMGAGTYEGGFVQGNFDGVGLRKDAKTGVKGELALWKAGAKVKKLSLAVAAKEHGWDQSKVLAASNMAKKEAATGKDYAKEAERARAERAEADSKAENTALGKTGDIKQMEKAGADGILWWELPEDYYELPKAEKKRLRKLKEETNDKLRSEAAEKAQ